MLIPIDLAPQPLDQIFVLAELQPRRAVEQARQFVASFPPNDPWMLFALGWSLMRNEQASEALPLLAQAHSLFAEQNATLALLCSGRALLIAGGTEATTYGWNDLVMAYQQLDLPVEAARTHIQQAGQHNILGLPAQARQLLLPLIGLVTAEGSADDRARLYMVLGSAESDLGLFDDALAHFAEAISAFNAAQSEVGVARCRLERSNVYVRRERFDLAQEDLYAARLCFERLGLNIRCAQCDNAIGLVESRIGRYDQAFAATLRARQHFVRAQMRLETAHTELNLGVIAWYAGLLDIAREAYLRARETYHALGARRMALICDRNLASIMADVGQSHAAFEAAAELLRQLENNGDALERAETLELLGLTCFNLGRADEAMTWIDLAIAAFEQLGNHAGAANSLFERGWFFIRLREFARAEADLRQAQQLLAGRPYHAWRVSYGLGMIAAGLGDTEKARGYYSIASAYVAQMRRTLASERGSSSVFAQAEELFHDAIALALVANDAHDVLWLAEQQRSLALARQLVPPTAHAGMYPNEIQPIGGTDEQIGAHLERLLYARHAVQRLDGVTDDFDSALMREALNAAYPTGWMALSFVITADSVVALEFGQHSLEMTVVPFDEALEEAIKQVTLPRYRPYTFLDLAWQQGESERPWAALAVLGERLISQRVRHQLRPDLPLLIVPGGVLHALPWAALRINDGWLCEQTTLVQLPALRLFPTLANRKPHGHDALLVGCQSFRDRAVGLAAVEQELHTIARQWPGSADLLFEHEATRQTIQAQLATKQYGVVHIASHAVAHPGSNELAHIKLSDGDLYLDDVHQLALDHALVVLSLCEGGAHDVLPGEELLGLSRALLIAGASAVVASSWQVHDSVVLALLMPFYAALRAGASAPQALAHAQRTLLAGQGEHSAIDSSSPLVWAGFSVLGVGLHQVPVGGTRPTGR